MSFSAEWLALRAPADDRARDSALLGRAAALCSGTATSPARIVDLGSGTGATLRALGPHVTGPQAWTLVDADAALLAEAVRLAAGQPSLNLTTREADLSADPAPWRTGPTPTLVTASALFDLTSAAWLQRLADALAADQLPLYTALTFDGTLLLSPTHPLDGAMIEAFHAHQRTDKGFGPAAGPHAGRILADALAAHGYRVDMASTPWRLTREHDGKCISAMLDGWAHAAEFRLDRSKILPWRNFHNDCAHILVGHVDILAVPPS